MCAWLGVAAAACCCSLLQFTNTHIYGERAHPIAHARMSTNKQGCEDLPAQQEEHPNLQALADILKEETSHVTDIARRLPVAAAATAASSIVTKASGTTL